MLTHFKKHENEIGKELEEAQKETIQNRFSNDALSPEEIKILSIELKSAEEALEKRTNKWLELSIKI
mgnify:CR=1 FL=1